MQKLLCIYHANCDDGFGAAWIVRHTLGDDAVEFHAASYGEDPPNVAGRRVLIVDFSYKRDVLFEMARAANGILVIDHHKTAAEDLGELPEPPDFSSWLNYVQEEGPLATAPQWAFCAAVFDMNRSGAGLTWDTLQPGKLRPRFIDYLEDRDLWRKVLPHSDEFTMALRSYPRTFKGWDTILGGVGYSHGPAVRELIDEGRALLRAHRRQIEDLALLAWRGWLPGVEEPCAAVNAPFTVASNLGNAILDKVPDVRYAVVYYEEAPGRWKYSLRSRDDLADVSVIAKQFGGGGHRNAAGFTRDDLAPFVYAT